MNWYVVQVISGHEKMIAERCSKLISKDILKECFIPEYICEKRFRGSWHEVKSPLFAGYVFMISDQIDELNVKLRLIPDFTKVIGKKKAETYPLDEEEVTFLKSFGEESHIVGVR